MTRGRHSGGKSGAENYAIGMLTSPRGIKNMYIYGGGILTVVTFVLGLTTADTVGQAATVVFEFYYSRLIPPLISESVKTITTDSWVEFFITHAVTVLVGISVATTKWDLNT